MENVFFEHQRVRVTNTRFIVGSQTYAMAGVTSVRAHCEPPNRTLPLGLVIVGALMVIYSGAGAKLLGLGLIALGIWIWTKQRPINTVLLCTSAGEVRALSDADDRDVDVPAVVTALNDAIIHRG
jgi:hypothetical protein